MSSKGLEDGFGVCEDFADVVVVCVVVGGDDCEDGGQDVARLFGLGAFLVDLGGEDVHAADRVGVAAYALVGEFVDVKCEFFTDASW